MTDEKTLREAEMAECWFCAQPILAGERAHRLPHGRIAVHTDCLRHDALTDGARPSDGDLPSAA